MGSGSSSSCTADNQKDGVGFANKGYTWYGFNVLSSVCKTDSAYILHKSPNVYLYICIGLALIIVLMIILRQRSRFTVG